MGGGRGGIDRGVIYQGGWGLGEKMKLSYLFVFVYVNDPKIQENFLQAICSIHYKFNFSSLLS